MHPILIPGAHVLRRDADTLQVGLDPDHRVLLPDTPANRRVVMAPPTGQVRASLRALLLEDDEPLRSAMPTDAGDPHSAWVRHSVAAAQRRALGAHDTGTAVAVHPYGGRMSELIAHDLRRLLRRTGVPTPERKPPGPRAPRPTSELHALVGVGEPPRAALDGRVAGAVPHLLVRFVEGRALLGPFVRPGVSACLRCADLHHCAADPAWPLLVEQYSRATRQDRPDGVPEPVDAALVSVALGWAAREIADHLAGSPALTTSRVITLSADLAEVSVLECPPHEDCGCLRR